MKINKQAAQRLQRRVDNMPETWEADCKEVKEFHDSLTSCDVMLTMEYCSTDNRLYVHSDTSMTGWRWGLSPLGVITYKDYALHLNCEIRIVDSGQKWATSHKKHLLRISESRDYNSNGVGTDVCKQGYSDEPCWDFKQALMKGKK